MSDWDDHYIKIIGPEIELDKFCGLYLCKTSTGRWAINHDLIGIKEYKLCGLRSYSEANLHFSSKGRLILITIHVKTNGYVDKKLIQKFQKEFQGLLFYSELFFDYDMTMHFSFTSVRNGKVCKKKSGVPVINNITISETQKRRWYEDISHSYTLYSVAHDLYSKQTGLQ